LTLLGAVPYIASLNGGRLAQRESTPFTRVFACRISSQVPKA
jgi:hypothetical protein